VENVQWQATYYPPLLDKTFIASSSSVIDKNHCQVKYMPWILVLLNILKSSPI